MQFISLSIPEVILIKSIAIEDHRGTFCETYRHNEFAHNGISQVFVQENSSESKRGVLRGLHYQVNTPQGKLINVVRGKIFDVAVDLRKRSPTFGKWVGVVLQESEHQQLWIPPQFAHGFYTLSEKATIQYKCTDYYQPQNERTILWNDSDLCIDWPLSKNAPPLLSEKDKRGSLLKEADLFL